MARKSKSKQNKVSSKASKSRKHKKELLLPSATLVATASMKAAIEACEAKVDAIVAECIENNCRFRDQKFDVLLNRTDCLYNDLTNNEGYDGISGSKRVGDLFKNPVFFLNGAKPDDIKQGYIGDCWFMAALAVVSNIPGLLEQLCVKRNEEIGVYGFIFFKDGDRVSTVVDDQLFYTIHPRSFKNSLYFSACKEERETWLPLMEKAYAKIHGDYKAIEGGRTAEGIEDLTGGIASVLYSDDILDKDRFWEEMKSVNKTHLMGCAINYVDGDGRVDKHGIQRDHAYSVLRVAEVEGERLVQIRNPWGTVEWNGDWSDDSDKWTPEISKALDHKKDDDGQFWMSYRDFLKVFTEIGRCRIFDSSWSVASSWISYNVEPRSSGKYEFEITMDSETVFVLTQPDTRFQGVTIAEYRYFLSFHIYDSDNKLVKRSRPQPSYAHRSVNCEVKGLKPGKYSIVPLVRRELNDVKLPEKPEKPGSDDDNSDSEEAQKMAYLFQQRKTQSIQRKSISRKQGRKLLGVDEEDYDEEEKSEEDKWQIMIGLRVYSHDPNARLEGQAGEHPAKDEDKDSDDESEEEPEDPESVTATLADKKKAGKKAKKSGAKSDKEAEKTATTEKVDDADKAQDEKMQDEKTQDEKTQDEKTQDEKTQDEKTQDEMTRGKKTQDEKSQVEKEE